MKAESTQFLAPGVTLLRKTKSKRSFVIEQRTASTDWHHRLTCRTPEIREVIFNHLINKETFKAYTDELD